jgi:predicted membrane-bound mannosyltransferase
LLPVHAEAVIWATAIPESLGGTFQLAAFYLFIRYRDDGSRRALAWSLALFACALLSHESAIVLPAIIGVYGLLFENCPRRERHNQTKQPADGRGEASEPAR